MNTTTTTWPGPEVIQASIERPTAMRLAQTEYQRVTDAVDALRPEDWSRPTDCTEWDVRQLVAHIAGQANLLSTPWEGARQMRAAQARQQPGQPQVDALTALQIEERQHLGPERAARRVASGRPAWGEGTPPNSRFPPPPTHAGGGDRQRRTRGMVAWLCH